MLHLFVLTYCSPIHEQQLAFLRQQALLMAAAKFCSAPPTFPGKTHQPGGTDSHAPDRNFPAQSWPNIGYQVPRMSSLGGQPNNNMLGQVMLLNTPLVSQDVADLRF